MWRIRNPVRVSVFVGVLGLLANAAHSGDTATAPASACVSVPSMPSRRYSEHVDAMDHALGVPEGYASAHALSPVPEASALVTAGRDIRGRPVKLDPHAAVALQEMIVAAEAQGVTLQIVSGYRSADYQAGLLRDKLRRGMKLDSALRINAPPGYSEHQSGCAVDLTTPHSKPADTSFAGTHAYAWLTKHAGEYGFHLSYPENNPHDIEFEPWHWRFVAPPAH